MDLKSPTLPVHERFVTFQGEGVHAGRKAFFIRTMGCPVQCPWCDSAGTWHKDWVPPTINRMPLEQLVAEVVEANPAFVVLTGGEPMIHANLSTLARMIRREGYQVHVETCGAYLQDLSAFDWITVSPTRDKPPLAELLYACRELKLIIDSPEAFDFWNGTIDSIVGHPNVLTLKDAPVWLHPEWSRREDPAILNTITRAIIKHGEPYRAGWQMHKLYRADALDSRSAPLAPLGGNPALGA